jgi:hypothetical protein
MEICGYQTLKSLINDNNWVMPSTELRDPYEIPTHLVNQYIPLLTIKLNVRCRVGKSTTPDSGSYQLKARPCPLSPANAKISQTVTTSKFENKFYM